MRAKIIGGVHKGAVLEVQDNITIIEMPDKVDWLINLAEATPEPTRLVCRTVGYKLYQIYRYNNGNVAGYFIPKDWVPCEVERILMDAI